MPPISGQTTLVEVFAEDAGTNNVSGRPYDAGYVIKARTRAQSIYGECSDRNFPARPGTFDLFATTIDLYQGFVDPYQGHTVAVLPGVTGT